MGRTKRFFLFCFLSFFSRVRQGLREIRPKSGTGGGRCPGVCWKFHSPFCPRREACGPCTMISRAAKSGDGRTVLAPEGFGSRATRGNALDDTDSQARIAIIFPYVHTRASTRTRCVLIKKQKNKNPKPIYRLDLSFSPRGGFRSSSSFNAYVHIHVLYVSRSRV